MDIADTYELEHQYAFPGNAGKGLFSLLAVSYLRQAEDTIIKCETEAMINGLEFDRREEAKAVDTINKAIALAAGAFIENPTSAPRIQNWNRVTSAIPDTFVIYR